VTRRNVSFAMERLPLSVRSGTGIGQLADAGRVAAAAR
jgi:hypothetical protein